MAEAKNASQKAINLALAFDWTSSNGLAISKALAKNMKSVQQLQNLETRTADIFPTLATKQAATGNASLQQALMEIRAFVSTRVLELKTPLEALRTW